MDNYFCIVSEMSRFVWKYPIFSYKYLYKASLSKEKT